MKKSLIYFALIIIMLAMLPVPSEAVSDIEANEIAQEIEHELSAAVDSDVRNILKEIGMDGFSFDDVYNISLQSISRFFADTLKNKISDTAFEFAELMGVILLVGVLSVIFADSKNDELLNIIAMTVISLLSVKSVSVSMSAVISTLEMSGKFMLSFVPIYALIISLGGNPSTALTYNTFVIGFAEILSSFITGGITDFLGVFFCLGISFSFNGGINTGRIISAVNKIFNTVIGFVSSVFTGFLSLKSILSSSVDSLSIKSIRFVIGSMIPVIGSSISDAYSSLLGSINLIKGSVAIVGILVIIIINIPIIFETLTHYISFTLLSHIAESVSAGRCSDVLKCFACGIRMLLLVCIFEMFILIISTGILLSVKNGG